MREIRHRFHEVAGDAVEPALRQLFANDEGMERDTGIVCSEAGERVIQMLGRMAEGDSDNGSAGSAHGAESGN